MADTLTEALADFSPAQFIEDAWDGWDCIEATHTKGFLADADREMLTAHFAALGLTGEDLDDAVIGAETRILTACAARVADDQGQQATAAIDAMAPALNECARLLGRKGGQARTPAKQAASRANGRLGGRLAQR